MITITQHSEFHARAEKEIDWDTNTEGYNFSYPVLNTTQIGNLLMSGKTTTIQIERMGKSVWSFNKETSKLTIQKSNTTEIHHIDNPRELYEAMSEHYKKHGPGLHEKNLNASRNKSAGKIGNQNARKHQANATGNEQENQPSEGVGILNQHGSETIENKEVVADKVAYEEPTDFCAVTKYPGSIEEYFRWVAKNGWWNLLSSDDKVYAHKKGIKPPASSS